jgi:hypothetical protein
METIVMTVEETILKAVEDLPDNYLSEPASYAEQLRRRNAVVQSSPMVLASERALAKDWLRPEEDEAWRNL